MLKVYAKFSSHEEAELASISVRRRCIGRCSLRGGINNRKSFSPLPVATATTAPDGLAFSPTTAAQPEILLSAQNESSLPEPLRSTECELCFEGSEEQVWRASHMLRGLGGREIDVSDREW